MFLLLTRYHYWSDNITGLKTKGFGVYCARLESPNTSINISFHSEGLQPTNVVF